MKENRRFLIVANWKANDPKFEIFNFKFENQIVEVAIAPPYPLITAIPESFTRAAQDVSAREVGAYTGEVPAKLLAGLGVKYCLVGHSERRGYFGETNAQVEMKMNQAIQNGITPILCAQTMEEIPENIRNLSGDKYMIMYEPFSAISTEGQYHPENVERIVETITEWKNRLNLNCRFLYGGSVNPDYVERLLTTDYRLLSGLVVGHASLEAESFIAIIKQCLQNLPSNSD